MKWMQFVFAFYTLAFFRLSSAFSLGDPFNWWTPTFYQDGEKVPLIVNKIESDSTQLPYGYYDLPFTCPPTQEKKPLHLSLNEIIRGDRKWDSDYHLYFKQDEPCRHLCDRETSPEGLQRAINLIRKGYVVEWSVDDLVGATTFISTSDNHKKYYAGGFPLGYEKDGKAYINNHVMMVLRYHVDDHGRNTIVGFEVYPRSVDNDHCPGANKFHGNFLLDPASAQEITYIPFTYSVYWREEFNVNWADRWKFYHHNAADAGSGETFHYMSLVNSCVVVCLLSSIAAAVLMRTLNNDLRDESRKSISQSWKSCINDVLREPKFLLTLTIMTGGGIQVIFTMLGSLILSSSGVMGPNIRNSVLSASLFVFVLGGILASFIGCSVYIALSGTSNSNSFIALLSGSSLPALVLITVLTLNTIVWAKDSTSALPFGTIVVLLLIYFLLEIPLSFIGGYYAKKLVSPRLATPAGVGIASPRVSFNKKPPSIVQLPSFLTQKWMTIAIFGLVPFATIYVELLCLFKSVWLEKTSFYYMYGFLLFNIVLLIIVVVESSIIATFLLLNYEEWHWQWFSFMVGSSVGWYIEAYSIYYFFKVLNMRDFSSIVLFFSYSTLFSALVGLGFGSLGLLGSLIFVKKIYGAVKMD